jgi:hypothetical protein
MEPPRINASEDGQTEDIASYNHARLIYRLTKSFSRYDARLDVYFPSGTPVVWIVILHFRQVTVMTPQGQNTLTAGVVRDDCTGIELDLAHICLMLHSLRNDSTGLATAALMLW